MKGILLFCIVGGRAMLEVGFVECIDVIVVVIAALNPVSEVYSLMAMFL